MADILKSADLLEPRLAKAFMRAMGRLRRSLPAQLEQAIVSGDVEKIISMIDDNEVTSALRSAMDTVHDASVRGATGQDAVDEIPEDVVEEFADDLDEEGIEYEQALEDDIKRREP